jgi:hypothetical protein
MRPKGFMRSISDDGKPVLQDGWNNHLSKVKKNRVKPLTSKVIKKTALGCDDTAAVLADGHINLVDGIAVYHIPVSSMEKWKPTTNSSCNANVPAEVEVKKKGKKRAAPASATPSRDEKKQDIGSSSSSPMDTTITLHTPLVKRKNDDREFEGVSEEPESKKRGRRRSFI